MEKYQGLSDLQKLSESLLLIDCSGKILDISHKACEILGVVEVSVKGINIKNLLDADIFENMGDRDIGHMSISLKNDVEKKITIRFSRVQTSNYLCTLSVASNDETLGENDYSDAILGLFFVEDLIFVKDLHSRYTYCNRSFRRRFEIELEDIDGITDYDLYNEREAQKYQQDDQNVFQEKKDIKFIEAMKIGEYSRYYEIIKSPLFDSYGNLKGLMGIGREITEHEKLEKKLTENEVFINHILTSLNHGFARHEVILNETGEVVDYRFLDLNEKFEQLTGLQKNHILGKRVLEIMPETEIQWIKSYGKVATTGESLKFEEYSRALNQTFSVYAFSSKLNQFTAVITDITELKKYENNLIESNRKLEVANQAKNLFLENMSHEIRTPMNGIVGLLDLLMQTELTVNQSDYLLKIKTSIGTLNHILEEIIDYTEISEGLTKKEVDIFSIKEVMTEIMKFYEAILNINQISLKLMVDNKTPDLFVGDRVKARQILINLIGNAIKFTRQGDIEVKIDFNHKEGIMGDLIICVKDTGIGIEKEKLKSIFDAFQQGDHSEKKHYQGLGLGLSKVSKLLNIMEGHIEIESEITQGSIFTVYIPMSIHNPDILMKEALEQKKEKVLIVDDDPVSQMILKKILEKIGYSVLEANNGIEAIQLVENNNLKIIFMDIEMPVMNGFEAAQVIRMDKRIEIPIVAVTGFPTNENKAFSKTIGINEFLSKPISKSALIEKLNKII